MTVLHALILAAGAARRYGSPKALAQLEGEYLLDIAVSRARAVVDDDFTVILGAYSNAILGVIPLDAEHVSCHDSWTEGLAESLKHGLRTVPKDANAALVMLVDQPAITAQDLRNLRNAWLSDVARPAAAAYAGDVGAPCILPRSLFGAAMRLKGDRGAKSLLHGIDGLIRVPMDSAAFDVDTPEDLERLAERTDTASRKS